MTASEFAFLAMGLVLGVAAGAALMEVLRARPPAPREVRVTVSTDAIPRRATTLADDAFTSSGAEPARGGPADRRSGAVMAAPDGPERRTPVPFPIASDGSGDGPTIGRVMEPALPLRGPVAQEDGGDPVTGGAIGGDPGGHGAAEAMGRDDGPGARPDDPDGRANLVAIPVSGGTDPMFDALRDGGAVAVVAGVAAPTAAQPVRRPATAMAVLVAPVARARTVAATERDHARPAVIAAVAMADGGDIDDGGLPRGTGVGSPSASPVEAGPCSEARRLADERCELASLSRGQAGSAEDALRQAQRAYDEHESRADEAASAADPRAVRRAKDEAQMRFRNGRSSAPDTDAVEAAARAWLLEINRINGEAREAAAVLTREREAARAVGASLERLSLEADAARIAAETAEAACLAARTSLADCEEAQAGGVGNMPTMPSGESVGDEDDEQLAAALGSGGTPRIFRLLRGDRAAMAETVTALAGDDAAERRRWQIALADLIDAILADAIESSSLHFPSEHPFWGPFTLEQDRDITSALSSLGYRFDGLGGWIDGRVPSQRDLSLALGYAGLDPMRIRHWPTETEMVDLFADVAVAGDEHIAGAAGDLTLGELVSMLGRRADPLAEVWNNWGRIRPLLLDEA